MKSFSTLVKAVIAKRPGRRFLYAYVKLNRLINKNIFVKIILTLLGCVFLVIGVALLFLPGPGLLFIVLAGLMFCVVSKRLAQWLDRLEVQGKDLHAKYIKRDKTP